jgi:rhamnosyltransferase
METFSSVTVIIPTCNAACYLNSIFSVLERQTKSIDEVIIIDSESNDNTVEIAKEHKNVRIIEIKRTDFNHGGTRHKAFLESTGDVVCFLTQDALPKNEFYIENLIKPIQEDSKVAMVGGRQIARKNASNIEKYVRLFNYKEISKVWDKKDREELGIKAFFISDSCSAYRRSAYVKTEGFEKNILTNEDMEIAARFLEAGYKLAYQADAQVYHSHNYTLLQQFKRNFDVGAFLSMYSKYFHKPKTKNEGVKMAKEILKKLIKERHFIEAFYCNVDFFVRFLGNFMGSKYKILPLPSVKMMSGQRSWWCEK